MKCIPKRLLIHSVYAKNPIGEDCFGYKSFSEETLISNVRVDFTDAVKLNGFLNNKNRSALLFFDCVNSSPHNFTFMIGTVINFNGVSLTADKISNFFDNNRLHHVEVHFI